MFRKTLSALIFAVAVCAHPSVALARGSGNIPCLRELVIKVADVPHDAGMALAGQWGVDPSRIRPGHGLDLGYRFKRCSADGRWVGYIGYGETDIELDDGQLHQLANAAGLSDLPPAPGLFRNPDIPGVMAGLAMACLFLLVRFGVRSRNGGLRA